MSSMRRIRMQVTITHHVQPGLCEKLEAMPPRQRVELYKLLAWWAWQHRQHITELADGAVDRGARLPLEPQRPQLPDDWLDDALEKSCLPES